jgi:hypothetical protein
MALASHSFLRRHARDAALVALPATLAIVAMVQLGLIIDRLTAAGFETVLCTTGALHTSAKPPQIQLTRDYAALRILLKDPADHFEQARRLYAGVIRAPEASRPAPYLINRPQRAKLLEPDYRRSLTNLQTEARRIDRERGMQLASRIEAGLVHGDRIAIEQGFREVFAVLLDEILSAIQQRLTDTSAAARSFQYAQRFYGEAIEAFLALQSPPASASAGAALSGMRRILDGQAAGSPKARELFDTERRRFVRTVNDALGL